MDASNIIIIVTGLCIAMVVALIIDYVAKGQEKRRAARADRQEPHDLDECEETRAHETIGSCDSPTRDDLQPHVRPPGQNPTQVSRHRGQRDKHLE